MSWTPIDSAPERGGVVGGDGAGESWSVRFAHRDYPRHTVTVYLYPVDFNERWGSGEATDEGGAHYDVEEFVAFEYWDGPWSADESSVIDADHEQDYRNDLALTEEMAEALAKSLAEDWHRNGARHIEWKPTA